MSKQIRPGIVAILMTLTLLASMAAVSSAGARQQRRRAVPAPAVRNSALAAATAGVLKETSVIRKLSILRQVRSSTQSRAEIERMLIKSMDEEATPAEIHATEITFKKLGLAPADFQFRQFLIQLLTEQVAGYYDPKSKQFYLADWLEVDVQKPVLAHELTHALQDQHFNLRRFEHWSKSDADAELAAHALVEGDATLVMELYIAENPMRALSFLKSMSAGMAATEQLDRAPRVVRETLLFPYFEGRFWRKSFTSAAVGMRFRGLLPSYRNLPNKSCTRKSTSHTSRLLKSISRICHPCLTATLQRSKELGQGSIREL